MMTAGKVSTVYEPKPGHAKVYFGEFKPSEAEEVIEILDLRGAFVSLARKVTRKL